MIKTSDLQERFARAGVFQYGTVAAKDVACSGDVREMCESNRCGHYGKTWACPPAVGTVDECRSRIRQYEKLLLFSGKYDLEDSLDYEGMMAAMKDFKRIVNRLDDEIRPVFPDYIVLSNEGCINCTSCTYPDAPCRFPDRAHGAIEGYGIWVSQLAKQAGINYINGKNTITYFGAVLYNEKGER
jgi:predicted metal-binding protein